MGKGITILLKDPPQRYSKWNILIINGKWGTKPSPIELFKVARVAQGTECLIVIEILPNDFQSIQRCLCLESVKELNLEKKP